MIDKLRSFHLQHINLGHCTSWEALEQPEGYEVRHISYPGDNPVKVVEEFMAKITAAVGAKTIDEGGYLKDKGTMTVVWSDEDKMALSIDGRQYSTEEFGSMIQNHEGFQMQFRFVDPTDSVLRKDELLMPVKVGHTVLMNELEKAIDICSDGRDFISYKQVYVFEEFARQILEKLELMKDSCHYHREAIQTAKDMVTRLEEVETDDDCFPTYLIELLDQIIGEEE